MEKINEISISLATFFENLQGTNRTKLIPIKFDLIQSNPEKIYSKSNFHFLTFFADLQHRDRTGRGSIDVSAIYKTVQFLRGPCTKEKSTETS